MTLSRRVKVVLLSIAACMSLVTACAAIAFAFSCQQPPWCMKKALCEITASEFGANGEVNITYTQWIKYGKTRKDITASVPWWTNQFHPDTSPDYVQAKQYYVGRRGTCYRRWPLNDYYYYDESAPGLRLIGYCTNIEENADQLIWNFKPCHSTFNSIIFIISILLACATCAIWIGACIGWFYRDQETTFTLEAD